MDIHTIDECPGKVFVPRKMGKNNKLYLGIVRGNQYSAWDGRERASDFSSGIIADRYVLEVGVL